ncbi:MAG TPA: type II secretion system protein N [Burkholderiaceae bacterium]|nr:type II secretion system protein N [Burkholderiaceae bacterium]
MRHPVLRKLAIVTAALAGALLVVITLAPAALLAGALHRWSSAHAELDDPTGTLWEGQAELVLASGDENSSFRTKLPGRISWRINPWRLLVGTLDVTVSNAAVLDAPLELRVDRDTTATIDANGLRLPAGLLVGLGAPWNTIRPGGELQLRWDTLHLRSGDLSGHLSLEWTEASSALSPIVPFGHYRLQADGIYPGALLQLDTISGPMEMIGSGTIGDGRRLRFEGIARVQPGTDPAVATQLSGLITLLGRRQGEEAILKFGN